VRVQPRYARASYNLGLALNQQGQTAEAIAALKQGESAEPGDPAIPYARATIHAQLGQKHEALEATSRAIAIDPSFADAQRLRMMLQRP
jgi:tetratricopeptide (TPR) repeat protein